MAIYMEGIDTVFSKIPLKGYIKGECLTNFVGRIKFVYSYPGGEEFSILVRGTEEVVMCKDYDIYRLEAIIEG